MRVLYRPRHTHGRDLEKFGLKRNFVWDPRNSLLLLRTVESSFDLLRAGFFFDGHTFNFIVLCTLQERLSNGPLESVAFLIPSTRRSCKGQQRCQWLQHVPQTPPLQ